MTVDLDELERGILSLIDELRDARITIKHDRDYIEQCEKHLPEMTNEEFWGKD